MTHTFTDIKYAPYFDNYLAHLSSSDIPAELERSSSVFMDTLMLIPEHMSGERYQAGKWSVAQVIQHVIETEMIFSYRALSVARNPKEVSLRGFDENVFVQEAKIDRFSMQDWRVFFDSTRRSTLLLFNTISEDQLKKLGMAGGYEVRVDLLFMVLAGHALHHAKVLKERYLPMIESN